LGRISLCNGIHALAQATCKIPRRAGQELGAWKSALMVKRYAHFAPEQLRAAAAKLAAFSSTVPENETPEPVQGLE
jgi:hypothetical protein